MRKCLVLLAMIFVVASLAGSGYAAEYDRYERGYRTNAPPPPPPPPPPQRQAAYVAPPQHAMYGRPYFAVQIGVYEPGDDVDGYGDYDSGGSFNFIIGARMSPIFAVEGTLGGFGADRYDADFTVVPMTIGARLIIPNPYFEPYFGAGAGIYFSSIDYNGAFGNADEDSVDFGGYLSIGADFWITPRVALNFEGRYHWIEADFDYADADLSGWTANLGIRVAF